MLVSVLVVLQMIHVVSAVVIPVPVVIMHVPVNSLTVMGTEPVFVMLDKIVLGLVVAQQ